MASLWGKVRGSLPKAQAGDLRCCRETEKCETPRGKGATAWSLQATAWTLPSSEVSSCVRGFFRDAESLLLC